MPMSSNDESEIIIAMFGGKNLSFCVQEMWKGRI